MSCHIGRWRRYHDALRTPFPRQRVLHAPTQPSPSGNCLPEDHNGRSETAVSMQEPTLDEVIGPEHLLATFKHQRRYAGQSPGPDGIRYSDLSIREVGNIFRDLSARLQSYGSWCSPARSVWIEKSGGGKRQLKIRNIIERVVAAAVQQAIAPLIDAQLSAGVHGCRPGHSPLTLIRQLERHVYEEGKTFVWTADIRRAFDHVHIDQAMQHLSPVITDAGLLWLIESLLRGHDGHNIGIDQGLAISPDILNLHLANVLDRPLSAACPASPLLRYVDDLIVCSGSASGGRAAATSTRRLLEEAGYQLHPSADPINLHRQGARVEVLGYVVRMGDGRLELSASKGSWRSLATALEEAHEAPNPAATAGEVVRGWCAWYRTSSESGSAAYRRVRSLLCRYGFRDILSEQQLREWLLCEGGM